MPKGGCGCNWFGRLTCTVRIKAVSHTMCSSGNVGRVMFGLDGGRDSCIHAGNDCIVTKAGVNAENVFHTLKTYGKVGESRDLRLSSLFLLCCLLLGTATLLGVSRHCRLLCTSDGVVLI